MSATRDHYRSWSAALLTVLSLGITACGDTTQSAATITPTGTLDGNGRTVVAFLVSTANNYVNALADAVRSEAARLNYRVEIIENNFDQTQQNQQVRQFLGSGRDAAAFIYWPATNESSANSARLMSKRAPVIQIAGRVLPQAEEYVTAYAGADQRAIGTVMGEMALKSVAQQHRQGHQFHGPDGKPNLLEITYPSGYQTGIDRSDNFFAATRAAFNLLATEHVTTSDAQGGFVAASQVIPKVAGRGIDYIVAGSNNIAVGVVKALEQNGIVPGRDVRIIAGDLSGDKQPLIAGKIESAVMQSPVIEGTLAVQTAAKYLATGEVIDGTFRVPLAENRPDVAPTRPYRTTLMPNPPILRSDISSFTFWDLDMYQLEF